jgi:hypothetical protein
VITSEQVRIKEDPIAIIKKWPMSECHRDIKVFLGFANFYRQFMKGFSRIVQPMTVMLKAGKEDNILGLFELKPKIKEAFRCLKNKFAKAPVLTHFDYEKPIYLETNAS